MSVLEHVLECDEERLDLLKEQEELANRDLSDLEPEDKQEVLDRMNEVSERLDLIEAPLAEAKAKEILCGLGF